MKILKKIISLLLIFLMVINTSCYSTYSIKKEEIESQQKITVITNDDERYRIITEKVTEDTLYGIIIVHNDKTQYNRIKMPVRNIKSIEGTEKLERTTILFTTVVVVIIAGLFFGLIFWPDSSPGEL